MINPYKLSLVLLALALGSAPLFAQPAPQAKTAEAETPTTEQTAAQEEVPAAVRPAQKKSTPSASGRDSPLDYRPSEEISEDVPVSFPVDI